ncbi:MAG: MBL fold metallo-hydrolase, partial [Candidatus Paceibacteria bacterium]
VKSVPREAGDSTHLVSLSFQDMLIASVSDLDRALNTTEVDFLGTPDICFVPVGGNGVMDYKTAVQTINTVQPRIVIPTFFATNDYAVERESIETFVNEYAVANPEYHDSVNLKTSDLPSGTTETYLLNLAT